MNSHSHCFYSCTIWQDRLQMNLSTTTEQTMQNGLHCKCQDATKRGGGYLSDQPCQVKLATGFSGLRDLVYDSNAKYEREEQELIERPIRYSSILKSYPHSHPLLITLTFDFYSTIIPTRLVKCHAAQGTPLFPPSHLQYGYISYDTRTTVKQYWSMG